MLAAVWTLLSAATLMSRTNYQLMSWTVTVSQYLSINRRSFLLLGHLLALFKKRNVCVLHVLIFQRINDDWAPEDAGCRYEEHPVPEKHVDELVVQVDGQYALHGIRLNVHHVLTADLHYSHRRHRFTSTDGKGPTLSALLATDQSCPCVHFVWPNPTQPINWLTQHNPTQPTTSGKIWTHPDPNQ